MELKEQCVAQLSADGASEARIKKVRGRRRYGLGRQYKCGGVAQVRGSACGRSRGAEPPPQLSRTEREDALQQLTPPCCPVPHLSPLAPRLAFTSPSSPPTTAAPATPSSCWPRKCPTRTHSQRYEDRGRSLHSHSRGQCISAFLHWSRCLPDTCRQGKWDWAGVCIWVVGHDW